MISRFNSSQNGNLRLTGNEKTVLKILLKNSRASDIEIAQKLKISSQAVSKIRTKLRNKKIIRDYVVNLDYSKLGINTFAFVLLEIPSHSIKKCLENKKVLKNSMGLYKVFKNDISHIGLFGFKNLEELDEYFDFINSKCSDYIKIKNVYTFPGKGLFKHSLDNLFFLIVEELGKEKYPVPKFFDYHLDKREKIKFEKLSMNEKEILKFLIKDCKISCNKIASELGDSSITVSAINKIRKRLQEKGVIKNYSILLDYEKLGINIFSFIFVNKKKEFWDFKDGFSKWASDSPNVIGCYKLNQNSLNVLFCGFRNLDELENYCSALESQNNGLLGIDKIYITSPKGIIKDFPSDLFDMVLK